MTPARKAAMLRGFEGFRDRIMAEYNKARDQLEADDFIGANDTLAALSISHAKTSLSLRSLLIREGVLTEDDFK